MQPPRRRSHRGLWIALGVIVLGVLCNVAAFQISSNSSPSFGTTMQATQPATVQSTQPDTTTQSTTAPTQSPQWTTTQTFTGIGIKKTAVFHVGDDWKILWSCDPSSFYSGQYNLQVYVYNSENTPVDVAVNTICKQGNTSDSTEEHQGGDIYLDINSEASWKIQVQELK
jgi:hypothetical protein